MMWMIYVADFNLHIPIYDDGTFPQRPKSRNSGTLVQSKKKKKKVLILCIIIFTNVFLSYNMVTSGVI